MRDACQLLGLASSFKYTQGSVESLDKGTAVGLLEALRSRMVREAQALYAELEAENAQLLQARPELAATLAGGMRCLRAIVYGVLKEMAGRL